MTDQDLAETIDRANQELAEFRQRVQRVEESNEQLRERLDQLEYTMDRLVTDLPTQTRSKREKLWAIVRYGVRHGSRGPAGVTVTKQGAAGAADCSPRHALNLFDDLEEQFSWATKRVRDGEAHLAIDLVDRDPEAFLDAVSTAFPEVDE